MLKTLNQRLRRLCSRLRWPRSKPKVVIQKLRKSNSKPLNNEINGSSATVYPNNDQFGAPKPIRIATFNAALFSMAAAVPKNSPLTSFGREGLGISTRSEKLKRSTSDRPKSILKQSPLHHNGTKDEVGLTQQQKFVKSKLRVSINLPDNEISLLKNRQLSFREEEKEDNGETSKNRTFRGKNPINGGYSTRTVLEVLRELDADILGLQDVKAEEEKGMKPLSDLASGLGMNYVFAESWAPEYGNAVLSKWPIKKWKSHKIFDETDFRNVLKVTIDVPHIGEVNFNCTHLDHLDETWRMKQINAIIQSDNDHPHILAGGLNSLDESDYSSDRWTEIVKYYGEMGKPTPKVQVMRFLKSKQYIDSKAFAGECEPVVMIAKGQSVQGTCKYGTRVDYILASPNSPYKFVQGSYSVLSSKGTSDHHIVKVDIVKEKDQDNVVDRRRKSRKSIHKVVKITSNSSSPKAGC